MSRKLYFVLLFACCLLASACNEISGTVTLDGLGMEEVTVVLGGDAAATAQTNSDGEYAFGNLRAGTYTVTMEPPAGYTRSTTKTVSVEKMATALVNFPLESAATRTTETGQVIGFREDNGSHAWLGIPYAAPPVGELRWRAPLPADSWAADTFLALGVGDP